jgi:hypothetical protein
MNQNQDILDAPEIKQDRWKLIRRLTIAGMPIYLIGFIFKTLHWPGAYQLLVSGFCLVLGLTLVMAIFGRLKAAGIIVYSLSLLIIGYSIWLFFIRIDNFELGVLLLEITGSIFVIGILLMLAAKAHKS